MAHLLRVGDYVEVAPSSKSSGGIGWITAIEGGIIVQYVVQKKASKQVDPDRITLSMIDNTGRSQSQDGVVLPSLLSSSYASAREFRNAMADTTNQPQKPKRRRGKMTTDELLKMPIVDMYKYMENQLNKQDGWLRTTPPPEVGQRKKQLTTEERRELMLLRTYMKGATGLHQPTEVLAHAFSVSDRWVRELGTKGVDQSRKKRSDAGSTVLTNPKKQKQFINSRAVFKKSKRRETHDGYVDRYKDSELNNMFDLLTDEERKQYEAIATRHQQRLPFLSSEIKTLLVRSNGSITFSQLESSLADEVPIISKATIRNVIMQLPDSQYQSNRIMPALSKGHRLQRLAWCIQFRLFWNNAKLIYRKTLILLGHMDNGIKR